jgi:molybdate transport system substrate-binding protein
MLGVRRLIRFVAMAAACLLLLAGCGSDKSDDKLTVLAATSLTGAVGDYASSLAPENVRTSFAGSDQLAAQIREGAPADVFAAADTDYPDALYRAGLVERPVVFARNRLVIAVRPDSTIRSVADLARPGVKLVIGSREVPIGAYSRKVLGRLPGAEGRAILANVRSEEPDVGSVVAKVAAGAADAGLVYLTDARAAGRDVRAVALPDRLQPNVSYAAAVVTSTHHPAQARRFLDGLLRGNGEAALGRAGFLPPP